MAGYLSALPALQTQVPDITPGISYLASIPDQLRQANQDQEKMNLLKQHSQQATDEFNVEMPMKVGKWAYEAGSMATQSDQWDKLKSTYAPYAQKYGLPDLPDFAHRDEFLKEGAVHFGKGPDYQLADVGGDTPGTTQKVWASPPTAANPKGEMLPVGPSKQTAEGGAKSPIGKIESDFKGGIITQEQRDAAVAGLSKGKGLVPIADAKKRLDTAHDSLAELESNAEAIINHPGTQYAVGSDKWHPRGINLGGAMPGSEAQDANALIETLKSKIFTTVLQRIRDQSKTGGAVGNVSDREGDRMENNLVALNNAQSYGQFIQQLHKLIDDAKLSDMRLQTAFDETYQGVGTPSEPEGDDPLGLNK